MQRRDSSSSDSASDSDNQLAEPWLTRILEDAAEFEHVLTTEPESEIAPPKVSGRPRNDSVTGLVGRDLAELGATTRGAAARIQRLAVTDVDWLESDERRTSISTITSISEPDTATTDATTIPETPDSEPSLTPFEKIALFENEFGVLTTSPDEHETILLEQDGAFWQEVAVLGLMHLTTHRLTFHASLLSTRPDLLPEQQILKSGPATIHRPNPYRKRKVWLELAHDMISTFKSGSEIDRVQPSRSILLSNVIDILGPPDMLPTLHSTHTLDGLTIILTVKHTPSPESVRISFDTEESTLEWVKDMRAALYLYRRNRHSLLSTSESGDGDGVRISIPLERIEKTDVHTVFKATTGLSMFQLKFLTDGEEEGESGTVLDYLGFAMLRTAKLEFLRVLSENIKLRRASLVVGIERAPIVLDFGPLTFVDGEVDEDVLVQAGRGAQSRESLVKSFFGIPHSETIFLSKARLARSICVIGFFAITTRFVCFWAKYHAISDAKYRFPISRIKGVDKTKGTKRLGYGMKLDIEGYESIVFVFESAARRDEVIARLGDAVKQIPPSTPGTPGRSASYPPSTPPHSASSLPHEPHRSSTTSSTTSTTLLSPLSRTFSLAKKREFPVGLLPHLPKVINLPHGHEPHIPRQKFVCLTIGSRGDVQPYISLGKGLMEDGHSVVIVTHAEYKDWIESWGFEHRTAGGDPGALMKLSVEHKMFSPAFFRESLGHFRTWLDELLRDAWEQCKDAEVLIESPSAMAGVHIAEALDIPYFRAFTMPWSKTSDYPHAFISPPVDSPSFNSGTYVLFDNVFWAATSGQINKWRRETLGIQSTDMSHMNQGRIPFLYNFSTAVVPKPLDWRDEISVCGYWFLDNPNKEWTAPASLLDFIQSARDDGKALVYIGFGSITVPKPAQMTRSLIKAVLKSDVRAIISKGWSARMTKDEDDVVKDEEYPKECYLIDSVPHDWLFPQLDAALHHGGAGTTGASLRAGIPTLIKPWFGDQFFWASRVQKLGAGLRVSSLRSRTLADALTEATTDRVMKEKAAAVGTRIRSEDGVRNAIHAIYTYLPRAGMPRAGKSKADVKSSNC